MNKIALYYSVFCTTNDFKDSLLWILALAENLKCYMLNRMYEKIDIIICTDEFTKKALDLILEQEGIPQIDNKYYIDHVKWKMFERKPFSFTGKIWRFYAFIDTEHDIVLSAEADREICSLYYLPFINLTSKTNSVITTAFYTSLDVLEAKSSYGPFNAGVTAINAKKIPAQFKKEVKKVLDKLCKASLNLFDDERILFYIIKHLSLVCNQDTMNFVVTWLCAGITRKDIDYIGSMLPSRNEFYLSNSVFSYYKDDLKTLQTIESDFSELKQLVLDNQALEFKFFGHTLDASAGSLKYMYFIDRRLHIVTSDHWLKLYPRYLLGNEMITIRRKTSKEAKRKLTNALIYSFANLFNQDC